MRTLAALERFFERLFERPSARVFGAHLEPVTLLRRIEREMEAGRVATSEGVVVPDRFTVGLHPGDLGALGAAGPALADDLADDALRFARSHGYRVRRRPRVDLVPDPRVEAGDPQVAASFDRDGTRSSIWSAGPPANAEPGPGEVPAPRGSPDEESRPDPAGRTGDHPAGLRAASVPAGAGTAPPADGTTAYRPPVVAGPLARLRILEPTGGDRTIVIDGAGMTIGRAPDNRLVLGDGLASRHHARVQVRQGTLVLVDMGSRNGTFVNGQAVSEVALGVGDQIRIGETRLLVEALATT